jgi:CheY-like chemotaxis protein
MRVIDATKVKGKSSVVTVYEVFDADPSHTIAFKNETIEDFEPGFVLYHSDEVADAKQLFEKVLQVNPHDTAAQIYLERCQKILSMTMPKKPTILVVDDMPFNIKVLTTLLGKNNFNVLVAENGKAALEVIKITLPHLILLDIMMPEMDGFEVCRLLKAEPKTQNIPIIFITALSEPEDKVKGFKLGAVDYITKPFRREEILARVKTHLHLSYLQQRASWYIKKVGEI